MKKKLWIIGFLFPLFLHGKPLPQGTQFFYLGETSLSFNQGFFTPFLNPAAKQEKERVQINSFYGTLSQEDFFGLGVGFPTFVGYFGFQFFYLDNPSFLNSSWGVQGYFSKEIAQDFFLGLGLNLLNLKDDQKNSALGISLSTGVYSSFFIQNIPFVWGVSLVNLGYPATLKNYQGVLPIALRIETQATFNFLGKDFLTKPFLALNSAFYPLGNTFSLGLEQEIYFLSLNTGLLFDANGKNKDFVGPLFLSVAAQYDFLNFAFLARYTLYPMADFDFNGKKEQKHLLSLSLELGSLDKKGPFIEVSPHQLTQKDDKIYLSPNNDGIHDFYSFDLKIKDPSGIQKWDFTIKDKDNQIVYQKGVEVENFKSQKPRFSSLKNTFQSHSQAFYPTSLVWPCVDSNGKRLPDGVYTAQITAQDFKGNKSVLGNSFSTKKEQILVIDTVAPKVQVEILYKNFSPNNDGIQDFLLIDHKNVSKEGLWNMEIRTGGAPVFKKSWIGKPDETVKWDGKNEDNTPLPDGKYEYVLKATDWAGNQAFYQIDDIYIDTKTPKVVAKNTDNYFSPNGDNIKDMIEVEQEFNKEGTWTGEILNQEGKVVKRFNWQGLPPKTMVWDGKNENQEVEKDGDYIYKVKGKDKAGNQTEQTLAHFTIDTTPPKAELFIPDLYFSPNQDGKKDLLLIEVYNPTKEDLWIGEISNSKGKVVKSFTWNNTPPKQFHWDGNNYDEKLVPDGKYQFSLKSQDLAGNLTSYQVDNIVLKTTLPQLELSTPISIFSPLKEALPIDFKIKGSEKGEIILIDSYGRKVFTQKISSSYGSFLWDGQDEGNQPVKDGPYRVVLIAEDLAGNTNQTQKEITLLTVGQKVTLSSNKQIMNPNKKEHSHIGFNAFVPESHFVKHFKSQIINEKGEIFFEEQKTGLEKDNFIIDFYGKSLRGSLPHGTYTKKLFVEYANGEVLESNAVTFNVDTKGPVLNLSVNPQVFSPDDDGEDDFLNIFFTAKDSAGIANWKIIILDRFKEEFKTFSGKEEVPSSIVWNGKSSLGELTDSAEDFLIMAQAEDKVGNISTTPYYPFSTDILVIKTHRGYQIRISNIEFALNKANLKPTALPILKKVAEKLQKFPQYQIKIEGHADSTGAEGWNEKLSLMRAEAVKAYLTQEKHLAIQRFLTQGLGSRFPLYPNDSVKNRAKNRRVEFLLIK